MDTTTAIVGYVASAVGTVLMLPQVVRSWRTRRVDDLSLAMVLLYFVNCVLWLIYGLRIGATPVWLTNTAGLAISIVQVVLKIRYTKRAADPTRQWRSEEPEPRRERAGSPT